MVEYFDPVSFDPTVFEKDFGTPEVNSDVMVTLEIDGFPVTVPEGTSVMRAAAQLDITIPKLCATDSLDAFGSCRVCAVQIAGRRGLPSSCTTPVMEGMKVKTQNDDIAKLRRNIVELYISDHPLDCLTCPANGNCELQDVAGAVGLREVRYGFEGENHLQQEKDTSNPYFTFDPAKCIVCSRCVRACSETQGSFALTVENRGFDSAISVGQGNDFLSSDCVSCGSCVQACPTSALMENNIIQIGQPERSVITTCAYCGVGCSFKAEMKGDQLVNMVPYKGGGANHGHSCVKGRFAFGYATHPDRLKAPMIREHIDEPWRAVSWEEAIEFAADKLKNVQKKYGRKSIGGITSSRCTNEEAYLVQKMIRGAFGNNNSDTCARVCHSPTGYGLKQTLGESAGTQDFDSVLDADVIVVMGANPTDAHPVFGSLLRKRLRQGAKLIVIDPRRIDLLDTPYLNENYHLALKPGSNVALINAITHVLAVNGQLDSQFVGERCEEESYNAWLDFILDPSNSPEQTATITGVPAELIRTVANLYGEARNAAVYYGLGVTEHSQGSTTVMSIANLAMATGNIGRSGVGINPLRGQNNVQGSCDMGAFPHELPGYQSVSDPIARSKFEAVWGVELDGEPGYRIPNMFDEAISGGFKGLYVQGEDIAQSDPNTQHVEKALRKLDCLIVQDIFLNETAKFAHVLLPGSSFLEKNGTFTNAERRINRVRKVMAPLAEKEDWEVTQALSTALGFEMNYKHPEEIMAEISTLVPSFTGVSYEKLEQQGSVQWPCNDENPSGMPIMHTQTFSRGKGKFVVTEYAPTSEVASRKYPMILTTGRILSQYNVGAQTRKTENQVWHDEDKLEIHPSDAEFYGINEGDWVGISSRSGSTALRATLTTRVLAGVVYTTFHHPESGANVITTNNSDWATNCPEYKVTAVRIERVSKPSQWQERYVAQDTQQRHFLKQSK
ncbi:formate dehydrogenase subunit alpha [Photobacterium minamisatsumaniensis]|uniref:formate dehydrogenase subunit alpha n=1 Tax=Photobacterium minamisatsumaniensis TaxID=2910233 RepID=UPI003D0FBA21